jgi:predicted nucleic acid-binding protein
VTLYLDTSSLVKLYVAEAESDAVRQMVEHHRRDGRTLPRRG